MFITFLYKRHLHLPSHSPYSYFPLFLVKEIGTAKMKGTMPSLWGYQEIIEELKQKLLYTTVELEAVTTQANEEMRKHKEYVKQSLQLLQLTIQERDEARDQLHKLLNKLMIPYKTPNSEFLTTFESPLIKPTRTNSSITESNSFSEPYNYQQHHSQNSSPVNSFLDVVSSPDQLSNNNVTFMSHNTIGQDYGSTIAMTMAHVPLGVAKVDHADIIMDSLVKGRSLPEKGKFLQAVVEAGPLLQTLLLAGPLPRWRNPPPLQLLYIDMSCGNSSSTSILNFGNGSLKVSARANGDKFVPAAKRQRL